MTGLGQKLIRLFVGLALITSMFPLAAGADVPDAPNVSGVGTPAGATLSWSPVSGASQYEIEYRLTAPSTSEISPLMKPFIVGGQGAPIGNHPWQVALIFSEFEAEFGQFCGGSLIASQWVLTAAHCVDFLPDIDVGFGKANLSDMGPADRIAVSQIYVHPDWDTNDSKSPDYALLKLASPVPDGLVIGMPTASELTIPGDITWASGWGNLYPTAPGHGWPDTLQEILLDVFSSPGDTFCKSWDNTLFDGDVHICVGVEGQTQGACSGDSGGPLSTPNDERWELAGVTSWGSNPEVLGCSHPDYPSIYGRTATVSDWVKVRVPDTQWRSTGTFSTTDYDLANLSPGYRYDVRVRSHNGEGPGPWSEVTVVTPTVPGVPSAGDEVFFYRSTDGAYRYYDMKPTGALGSAIRSGSAYSTGWDSITAIDLNGDGKDESFFYRSTDGAFRYYEMHPNGKLGTLLQGGTGYSTGWDSITAIDLNGDGKDESFFYRSSDGAFRYYEMHPNGKLGTLLQGGTGYSTGWDSITAIDLNGDGKDESFFYRSTDGAFRYYEMHSDGRLGTLLQGGTGYSLGWDSITAIDVDGDGKDESFFYRSTDGAFRYYQMHPNGKLGTLLQGGTGYSTGWDSITAINLG